ncbi:MAG: hypothetical protein K1X67_21670 [Fimbriimonadaceae bacterium]|nr:hypothetical protein [Fimbriimonadaceae bacterium]
MKILRIMSLVVALLSLLALVASFPIESSYASKAVLAQRVEQSEASSLFGETGAKIGSPQRLVISDKSVFLPGGENGVQLVDEAKLKEKGIYPLQMQTVTYVIGLTRVGSGVAVLVALAGIWLTGRRKVTGGPLQAVST